MQSLLEGKKLVLSFTEIGSKTSAVISLDECLGVGGPPRSATGQTALLTGKNAPAIKGRHINGFLARDLQKMIDQDNIFLSAIRKDKRVLLANAYSSEYFVMIKEQSEGMPLLLWLLWQQA